MIAPAAQRVLEFIRERGECSPREIQEAVGFDKGTKMAKYTTPLVERGLIEVSGSTRDRSYRPAGMDGRGPTIPVPGPKSAAPSPRLAENGAAAAGGLVDRVLQVITVKQGDRDDHAIARKLDVPVEQVTNATAQLRTAGRIWATPSGAWALGAGPRQDEFP